MELEKLDSLYGEIAQTVNEMIPKSGTKSVYMLKY